MTIDGYYLPDAIGESAQRRADQSGTTQHVGLVYSREPHPMRTFLAGANGFFRDLAVGRFCTWVYGPAYDELKQLDDLAIILWISPSRGV